MNKKDLVMESIFSAIDEINEQLPVGKKINKSLETVLVDQRDGLDSLGLVNFIVSVEQKVEENFGVDFSLTLGDVGLSSDSPLRTVETLEEFIFQQIEKV